LASNHEYAVIGHSRATVGRFLGIVAGLASSLLTTLVLRIAQELQSDIPTSFSAWRAKVESEFLL